MTISACEVRTAQVKGALVLSVVVRSGPLGTAVNGTLVARPVGDAGEATWY